MKFFFFLFCLFFPLKDSEASFPDHLVIAGVSPYLKNASEECVILYNPTNTTYDFSEKKIFLHFINSTGTSDTNKRIEFLNTKLSPFSYFLFASKTSSEDMVKRADALFSASLGASGSVYVSWSSKKQEEIINGISWGDENSFAPFPQTEKIPFQYGIIRKTHFGGIQTGNGNGYHENRADDFILFLGEDILDFTKHSPKPLLESKNTDIESISFESIDDTRVRLKITYKPEKVLSQVHIFKEEDTSWEVFENQQVFIFPLLKQESKIIRFRTVNSYYEYSDITSIALFHKEREVAVLPEEETKTPPEKLPVRKNAVYFPKEKTEDTKNILFHTISFQSSPDFVSLVCDNCEEYPLDDYFFLLDNRKIEIPKNTLISETPLCFSFQEEKSGCIFLNSVALVGTDEQLYFMNHFLEVYDAVCWNNADSKLAISEIDDERNFFEGKHMEKCLSSENIQKDDVFLRTERKQTHKASSYTLVRTKKPVPVIKEKNSSISETLNLSVLETPSVETLKQEVFTEEQELGVFTEEQEEEIFTKEQEVEVLTEKQTPSLAVHSPVLETLNQSVSTEEQELGVSPEEKEVKIFTEEQEEEVFTKKQEMKVFHPPKTYEEFLDMKKTIVLKNNSEKKMIEDTKDTKDTKNPPLEQKDVLDPLPSSQEFSANLFTALEQKPPQESSESFEYPLLLSSIFFLFGGILQWYNKL
jgi:hypothetical protein